MSKFAKERAPLRAPIATVGQTLTHEGGQGWSRDAKSELFLLAVTNMVSEKTFYEGASERDNRFETLVHQVTTEDPAWIRGFVPYLRDTMQMRSASLVMAAEYVKAGGPNGRSVIASALSRADEPAEMLAYWYAQHGRSLPAAVKRGVADAVGRLYNERAALKYDSGPWRMGDVIEVVHPKPTAEWQSDLFRFLLDRRHDRGEASPKTLPMISARMALQELPSEMRAGVHATTLKAAGMTWEALSAWRGKMDAAAWESVIPSMGYMALLRNLRNFEQAGVSEAALKGVTEKLADPEEVAKSRQFPIRFYSAWKATGSMTFGPTLEDALRHSVSNIPKLPGRSLILVDCSGSMFSSMSDRSQVDRYELAAVFGSALALRAESADLIAYGSNHGRIPFRKGGSVLRLVEVFGPMGGTETWRAVEQNYSGHDRIVILTDEQAFAHTQRQWGYYDEVDPSVSDKYACPIYTFNLAGYKPGHTEAKPGRYTFGGLTDAGFRLLSLLEARRDARWPWEVPA